VIRQWGTEEWLGSEAWKSDWAVGHCGLIGQWGSEEWLGSEALKSDWAVRHCRLIGQWGPVEWVGSKALKNDYAVRHWRVIGQWGTEEWLGSEARKSDLVVTHCILIGQDPIYLSCFPKTASVNTTCCSWIVYLCFLGLEYSLFWQLLLLWSSLAWRLNFPSTNMQVTSRLYLHHNILVNVTIFFKLFIYIYICLYMYI